MPTTNSRQISPRSRKPRLETTVRVGSYDYRIRLVHGMPILNGKKAIGCVNFVEQLILVSDAQPLRGRWRTFWHELGHAWQHELVRSHRPLGFEEVAEFVEEGLGWIDLKIIKRIDGVLRVRKSHIPANPEPSGEYEHSVGEDTDSNLKKAAKR